MNCPYRKPTTNITLYRQRLNAFLLRLGRRPEASPHHCDLRSSSVQIRNKQSKQEWMNEFKLESKKHETVFICSRQSQISFAKGTITSKFSRVTGYKIEKSLYSFILNEQLGTESKKKKQNHLKWQQNWNRASTTYGNMYAIKIQNITEINLKRPRWMALCNMFGDQNAQ